MANFVWPAEVQWPPPAHVLLNYDVTQPVASAEAVEAQGVLDSTAVVPDTHGGTRVVIVPPPEVLADLQGRVLALEEQMSALTDRVAAVEDRVSVHDQRLADLEAVIHVPPTVVDETATYATNALQVGVVVRTMQASGNPSSWTITDETRNGLPTTGYWHIDAAGGVSPTQAGVAGIGKHNKVEI